MVKVYLDGSFHTKEEVLDFLADYAVNVSIATKKEGIYSSFIAREEQGSTGLLDGFAIPHAKNEEIKQAEILFVKLTKPVKWETIDNQPVQFIIALFIPEKEAGTTHLKMLSQIARLLMSETFRNELKHLSSQGEIERYLTEKIVQE
ncbi:PTS system, fructose-specific IIA component [Pilibacter termitis]|uniref:PTS system, fructose-specific IIA component n=1 Tax=Pilibacter termitis TaxID=263852 RepID=A0A1T4PBJ1_9ENTE|nr:fructose PTS transporter subunit IIA [Pilibacter termitis]SJZ88935.1 PTS system, fructose-specific IIA component [Pilibacter termitis]